MVGQPLCNDPELLLPSLNTIWVIYANVTVGARQSEAVGTYHPEKETVAGELFHALLFYWQLVLPATFHFDETGAGTWQSTTGRRKRLVFLAKPREFLPHVQSAGVDS